MIKIIRNPVWMTTVVVLVIAITLVGSALIAANKPAKGTCPMQGGSAACPMSGGKSMGTMANGAGCCLTVDAKVLSVNSDGSYTVRVKPLGTAKKAFTGVKAGGKAPLMVFCSAKNCAAPKGKVSKSCPMFPKK